MEIVRNLIIVSLLLLIVTINCYGKNIDDHGPAEVIKLSNRTYVTLGFGTNSNYLPIIESNTTYDPVRINCIIHTRAHEKCSLLLDLSDVKVLNAMIDKITQFDEKRVMIRWDEVLSGRRFRQFVARITTVNVNTCKITNHLKFPLNQNNQKNFVTTALYKNGFNVISSINSINSYTTYDPEGQKVDELKPFLFNDVIHSIDPLSLEPHPKGFFIVTRENSIFKLILIDFNGKKLKDLIESEAIDVVSNISHSLFSICWNDIMQNETMIVNCVQFDLLGNEKYRDQLSTIPKHDWLLEIRSLNDSGLVLFTFNGEQEMLYVSVIKPNLEVKTLNYKIRSMSANRRIVDFNESDGTFVFACEIETVHEHKIVLQKYYLPGANS